MDSTFLGLKKVLGCLFLIFKPIDMTPLFIRLHLFDLMEVISLFYQLLSIGYKGYVSITHIIHVKISIDHVHRNICHSRQNTIYSKFWIYQLS